MKDYSIDLDLIKQIFQCKGVTRVDYRLSSSRQGFHFLWTCNKKRCTHCSAIEELFDDPKRYRHDLQRPRAHRRILWQSKGGNKAGQWKTVLKKEKQK